MVTHVTKFLFMYIETSSTIFELLCLKYEFKLTLFKEQNFKTERTVLIDLSSFSKPLNFCSSFRFSKPYSLTNSYFLS